jgi:hypothetical protein
MNNWFDTLNDALSAEGIINTWDISYSPIGYGETYSYTYNDGTKYGHFVSIYRDENGRYERPIHYARG